MKKIGIVIAGFIILTTCGRKGKDASSALTCVDIKQTISHQFKKLNEFKEKGPHNIAFLDDSIPKVNHKIFSLIKELSRTRDFGNCDLDSDEFTFISSADNKLKFISWDTQEGGTMVLFASAVIFRDKDSLRVERVMTKEGESLFRYMYEIHTIQNSIGQNVYLVKGLSIGSSRVQTKSLMAYTIDNGLNPIAIFPDAQSEILVEYEIPDSAVEIRILDMGKKLLVPIVDAGELTGKEMELYFNGLTFATKFKVSLKK